jgi:antitoxin (DNA-binding transcriptional repressor) of toxin-antitoxin stability system
MHTLTIKELHDETGMFVRRAGAARYPVTITDHGKHVAVLANPLFVRPRSRKRILLPEYEAMMMAAAAGNNIQAALDEIRGER